jgi:hypothetical protein
MLERPAACALHLARFVVHILDVHQHAPSLVRHVLRSVLGLVSTEGLALCHVPRHVIDYLAINAVSGYFIAATSVQVCAVRPARSNTVSNVPIDKINEWTSSR